MSKVARNTIFHLKKALTEAPFLISIQAAGPLPKYRKVKQLSQYKRASKP
jgi:hypothetical protein